MQSVAWALPSYLCSVTKSNRSMHSYPLAASRKQQQGQPGEEGPASSIKFESSMRLPLSGPDSERGTRSRQYRRAWPHVHVALLTLSMCVSDAACLAFAIRDISGLPWPASPLQA
eukprot:GHVU01013111.1.p1 GENE.GHVU01013111.1~~GHVU01013111.1.p1  ORF type:complete len:115 (-),score=2.16 GHVU01013111.1:99-443(-)